MENNKELIAIFTAEGFTLDFDFSQRKGRKTAQEPDADELYQLYLLNPHQMLYSLGLLQEKENRSPSIRFLIEVAGQFFNRLAQTVGVEQTRENTAVIPSTADIAGLMAKVPFALGAEFIDSAWIENVFSRLTKVFSAVIAGYPGSVAEYFKENNAKITVFGRVFFHLVENKADPDYPFAFLATYSTGNLQDRKANHTPLKNALLEYENQDALLLKLLSTVSTAAERSSFISELVESGEIFSPLRFSADEAHIFLKEVPLYEECGILCRIPDWWKKKSNSISLNLNMGEERPTKVGLDSLLSFNPALYFGDEVISADELKALLGEGSGLALIKGKWVEVDHEKLSATLNAYEKAKELAETGLYTMAEAMRLQLSSGQIFEIEDQEIAVEVTNGEWLSEVVTKLNNPPLIENIKISEDFRATLRGYQQEGVNWLKLMTDLGFGACLADDMGLGKTIQVIALLEHMRQNGGGKALLIIPASLMGNWQKEIAKFAPKLNYQAVYSSKDTINWGEVKEGVVITTYGLATRLSHLTTIKWDLIILDEAQAIKNPGTKQTKAIKKLKGSARIALTGTPIENKLGDLWSLFDFLNQGLLGTAKEFQKVAKNLSSQGDYSRLREIINPFILRRLKTDKSIIADLPDKIELKTYTGLSPKQVALYQGLVNDLEQKIENAEGIQRKGLVLASIMKAKQICNHPDHYLGQVDYQARYSGKFERLGEICATIAEKRERVLIFTQFREMTDPLAAFLTTIFRREGLILHGGTPVKKRAELVERFNGAEYVPFMVLSLKAGGVGLNLTAANHVIHFDRWWNPAVENQATDRAFRIGQEKNVLVHKFITTGTVEERIDEMIGEKTKLAADLLTSSGESWITELDNNALLELFKLTG